MASISVLSASTPTNLSLGHGLRGKTVNFTAKSLPSLRTGRRLTVKCDSGDSKGPLSSVQDAIKKTKVDITPDMVKKHQETELSEKQSVVGTVPSKGTTIPRPEIERRPETGDTSFGSLMAFDGAGPETINGRLAMWGFAWAIVNEFLTHQRIVDQLSTPYNPGAFWFVMSVLVIFWASLVPMFKGESPDSRRLGPFYAKAERWNGRIAMVGFVGLLLWEGLNGVALIN